MTSKLGLVNDEDSQTNYPPLIILNPRRKIEAGQVSIEEILSLTQKKKQKVGVANQLVPSSVKPAPAPPVPTPMLPLNITWSPNALCFTLDTEPAVAKLWIWNCSTRSIYIHCCGLWGDTARLGASWCVYPRTRFWLPPGLKATVYIRATPREYSPVPITCAALQIAAGHMRDHVTGYFSVSIKINFENYVAPPMVEGE